MPPTPDQQARAAAIAAELARLAAGFALPGTLIDRTTRCGNARCRCRADPPQPHGPYHQWTRKDNGRTATRILTDDQLDDYAPWFDNHKRIRELLAELEDLSLGIADSDPRWNRRHRKPPQNSVDGTRLTRGCPRNTATFPQGKPKREDLLGDGQVSDRPASIGADSFLNAIISIEY